MNTEQNRNWVTDTIGTVAELKTKTEKGKWQYQYCSSTLLDKNDRRSREAQNIKGCLASVMVVTGLTKKKRAI